MVNQTLAIVDSPPVLTPISAAPSSATRQDEAAIVIITSLGHALCHLGELVFAGVLVAVKDEFRLEPGQATLLALPGYVLMGVGALPVGLWADRYGPMRPLTIYFISMAAAGLAAALAPNFWWLFVALTALGLAASIYHPAGLAMISLGVKARGRAMGINGVAGSIGVTFGPFLGLLAASWGMWRLAYLGVACLAVVGFVSIRLANRRSPLTEPIAERPIESPSALLSQTKDISRGRPYFALSLLFFAMMVGGFNYRCLMTALPTFLSSESAAGSLAVLLTLGVGGLGQYAGGWLADRLGSRLVYPLLIALLVPLAIGLASLGGGLAGLAVGSGFTFCLFAQQPVENSLLAENTSAGRRSLSYGTKFILTFGIGALGAYVTGLVWDRFDSLGPVFYLIAGCAALMALVVLLFVWIQHRHLAKPAIPKRGLDP